MKPLDLNVLKNAASAVQSVWPNAVPASGLILGSGWAEAAQSFSVIDTLSYAAIPGLGQTTVAGHDGSLLYAQKDGQEFFIFKGRRHLYEDAGWAPVVLPIWLLKQFGAQSVLLTNAAGGIRDDLQPGTLMAVCDHINCIGGSPLTGPHNPVFGERFPDQSELYSRVLCNALMDAGADTKGVYLATAGPSFETPAEIRAYRSMGADAVGMSTVPEAVFANALGLRIAGLSCICNRAAGLGEERLTAEDIIRVARETMPNMRRVLDRFTDDLHRA